MKSLLTLPILCACLFLPAQTYQPFPTNEASWKTGRCWYFYPGGWHDEITFDLHGGDTTFNSVSYKKIYMKFHHAPGTIYDSTYARFLGGMRESGKKIFFVSEELNLDMLERMIYDFNYELIGDTILTNVLSNGNLSKVPHVITTIDSVLVGAAYHRRLNLSDTSGYPVESWIEGVGSSWGLVYASYWTITDNSYDLVCFSTNSNLKYQNPSPGYAFCTAPYPNIECDTGIIPNSGCSADFSYSKQTDTVSFSGSSNHVSVFSWQWAFGDNQSGIGQNPQHIYAQEGWYEACLTVTGTDSTGLNCTATVCDSFYIANGCIDSSLICPPGSLCCDAPLYAPVCGCDSVTYDNACIAMLWHGVIHHTDGHCLTSLSERNSLIKRVRLLPNPAEDRTVLKVEAGESGNLIINVRNILGEPMIIREQKIANQGAYSFQINLENIPAGIYFVQASLNGKHALQKLIRE